MNISTPKHQLQHQRALCRGSVLCVMTVVGCSWKTVATNIIPTQTRVERMVRDAFYDPGKSVG
ncbi:MAG: hypothetical protein HN516_12225 [Gammaproteobacteria bacterium]|nr:hypothetical protein [Gammaproteobacteria bacterium]